MPINCRQCKYFFITWDPKAPNGCKALGMKTKKMPSWEVYSASGIECLKFTPKLSAQKSDKKRNDYF